MKLKYFCINYRSLKTRKHSISIDLYCFSLFMIILIDNLLMQFFHILNRTMYLSKKILYQYFVFFVCLFVRFFLIFIFVIYLFIYLFIYLLCHYIPLKTSKIYITPDSLTFTLLKLTHVFSKAKITKY